MTSDAAAAVLDQIDEIVAFHGHMCPGLAMGVQAARVALDEIGPHAVDEEIVAITETDMCAVDAIQFLTGCTFGKGNLVHADYGKNAFTFFRRSDGRAVRVVIRPDARSPNPERAELFSRIRSGEATTEERQRYRALQRTEAEAVLAMAPTDLYAVERFTGSPPPKARIHATITCDGCGEGVMQTRIVEAEDGRSLCIPCSEPPSEGRRGDRPNLFDM
jgi:formylmethanofuran dehydrogenase subunit E